MKYWFLTITFVGLLCTSLNASPDEVKAKALTADSTEVSVDIPVAFVSNLDSLLCSWFAQKSIHFLILILFKVILPTLLVPILPTRFT